MTWLPVSFKGNLNIVVKLNRDGNEAPGEFFSVAQVVTKPFDEGLSGKGVQQGSVQVFPHALCARSPGQQSRNKAERGGDCECEKIQEPTSEGFDSEEQCKSFGQHFQSATLLPNATTTITAGMRKTNPPTTVVLMNN